MGKLWTNKTFRQMNRQVDRWTGKGYYYGILWVNPGSKNENIYMGSSLVMLAQTEMSA